LKGKAQHRSALWRAALVIGLLCVVAAPSLAETTRYQRMAFAERGGQLVVDASFAKVFDAAAARRLDSGIPQTLVMRLYIYRKSKELPVSLVIRRVHVVFDLWEEAYVVRDEGPTGVLRRKYSRREDLIRSITTLHRFPVSALRNIRVGPHHFLAAVVELNPVSAESLAEMRRWLTKPSGEAKLDTSSSFFGSFVSIFVNPKLRGADRVLSLRSQPFYRVPH